MSIKAIKTLGDNVLNVVILVQSPSLAYYVKNSIKKRFAVHRGYSVDIDTAKQLHNAKLDSLISPMFCDKWVLSINADKIPLKDLAASIAKTSNRSISVYWTEKWGTFNKLKELDIVSKQGSDTQFYRLTRLGFYEILDLLSEEVDADKRLPEKLEKFVAKNYQFDVQSVMDLIGILNSGVEIQTKKDVVEAIGIGGNSVASLLIKLVTNAPDYEKQQKNALKSALERIRDLTYTYNYSTIRKFLLNNIDGCIEMKQLQYMGVYNSWNKEIPETYDAKRLNMLRRFERVILNEVPLQRFLNLKLCLLKYNSFNAELALYQAIAEYYSLFEVKPDPPRKTKKGKKSSKKNQTVEERAEEALNTAFTSSNKSKTVVISEDTVSEEKKELQSVPRRLLLSEFDNSNIKE